MEINALVNYIDLAASGNVAYKLSLPSLNLLLQE